CFLGGALQPPNPAPAATMSAAVCYSTRSCTAFGNQPQSRGLEMRGRMLRARSQRALIGHGPLGPLLYGLSATPHREGFEVCGHPAMCAAIRDRIIEGARPVGPDS